MSVILSRHDAVAQLSLNRPHVKNAFDAQMISDISTSLQSLSLDQSIRLLVITGEGKFFSAGADLNYMHAQAKLTLDENFEDAKKLGRMFSLLASFPTPVISLVQGGAIGGGFGLAVCSDYVIAEESAIFALSEVKLGLVPGVIGPYVTRKCGLKAAPLILSGEQCSAQTAKDIGLVHQIVSTLCEAREYYAKYLQAAPQSARKAKSLLLANIPLPSDEICLRGARAIAEARTGIEGQAGIKAFLKKESPPWR